MEYKYLSDGRKVLVVGQLNNQETIVQEIFVTKDGDEIPSGERFTVKSLHDEPVESYKDRESKRLDQKIEEQKREIEKYNLEKRQIYAKLKGIKDIFESSTKLSKYLQTQDFDRFIDFISGNTKYVIFTGYRSEEIVSFENAIMDFDNYNVSYRSRNTNYDGLKLCSIFGNSEGGLDFRINQYKDGSGCWNKLIPCSTLEEAKEIIKERILNRLEKKEIYINEAYELLKNDSINKETKERVKAYIKEKLLENKESKIKEIENFNKQLEKTNSDIEDLESYQ